MMRHFKSFIISENIKQLYKATECPLTTLPTTEEVNNRPQQQMRKHQSKQHAK